MIEFCYDPVGIACFIDSHSLGARSQMELLGRIFSEDAAFLRPDCRDDKKRFFSDTLYWVNYLVDKVALDAEYPAIEKDFMSMGAEISRDSFLLSEYSNVGLFFMNMRLQISAVFIARFFNRGIRRVFRRDAPVIRSFNAPCNDRFWNLLSAFWTSGHPRRRRPHCR